MSVNIIRRWQMEHWYLRSGKFIEVWSNVETDPVDGTGQCDSSEEQNEEHDVGISGWKINHLKNKWQMHFLKISFCIKRQKIFSCMVEH